MLWKGLIPTLVSAARTSVTNLDKAKMLFVLGTGGVIGTAITAAKASPISARRVETIKADDFQLELTEGEHRKYRAKRYAKEVLPLWIPCGISMATAIVGFGMSNKQFAMRAAAASAAAGIAERMLESYSEKALEIVGEETEAKIRQAVADDIPDEVLEKASGYLTDNDVANLYPHMTHDELWYDHVTGRLFWAKEADIFKAESDTNMKTKRDGFGTIADFYSCLMLESGKLEEANGWDANDSSIDLLEIHIGSRLDPVTGLVMKAIDYRTKCLFPKEQQGLRIF